LSHASDTVPSPLSPQAESRPGLLRVLGPGMAIALVVGNVIGSGIFKKPGQIAANAGDFWMIIAIWVFGGVLCLLGALCFAELAVMLPRAGGMYVYLREAYGRPVAFLFGWSDFLFGRPASIGALSVAIAAELAVMTGRSIGVFECVVIALVLITAMAWINILGVIWGGRFQALTTVIKAGFVGILAVLPFVLYFIGSQGIEPVNYSSTVEPVNKHLTAQFAAALLAIMWAYNGWHGITPVAEEIRNPRRNIPLALFGGIGLLVLLYVSVNFAYHGVLTMEEVKAAGENVPQAMVRKLFGSELGVIMVSSVIICSMLGAINSNILNGPRVSFAMGRDDVFVRQLGRVHVNYRTPVVAILVQSVMAALLVIGSVVRVQFVQQQADETVLEVLGAIFESLTSFVVFSASIFYMLTVFSVIVLRRKRPDWERSYRTLGYPVVPILYLVFYSWFLYQVYDFKRFEANVGLGLIALGVPVYYAYRAWARKHPERLHDGM
jgi:APA family basic amino acid/polyamine antiporter